ncbi:DUF2141 domain-containing protein [Fibrella sp. WM1]|uniref:DUF2141 domain-containing protein n=1 Tax=Fibrella musci TaxID=3242485 RepID=UPI0035231121
MLIFLLTLTSLLAPHPPIKKTTLTVEAQNIRDLKGQVRFGLFASENGFPDKARPMQAKSVGATGRTVQATFEVEPGTYALAIYHDLNSNDKIDKKMFGIPTEPYGFSNNVRPRMSAPSYDDCKVVVGEAGKTISIQLK